MRRIHKVSFAISLFTAVACGPLGRGSSESVQDQNDVSSNSQAQNLVTTPVMSSWWAPESNAPQTAEASLHAFVPDWTDAPYTLDLADPYMFSASAQRDYSNILVQAFVSKKRGSETHFDQGLLKLTVPAESDRSFSGRLVLWQPGYSALPGAEGWTLETTKARDGSELIGNRKTVGKLALEKGKIQWINLGQLVAKAQVNPSCKLWVLLEDDTAPKGSLETRKVAVRFRSHRWSFVNDSRAANRGVALSFSKTPWDVGLSHATWNNFGYSAAFFLKGQSTLNPSSLYSGDLKASNSFIHSTGESFSWEMVGQGVPGLNPIGRDPTGHFVPKNLDMSGATIFKRPFTLKAFRILEPGAGGVGVEIKTLPSPSRAIVGQNVVLRWDLSGLESATPKAWATLDPLKAGTIPYQWVIVFSDGQNEDTGFASLVQGNLARGQSLKPTTTLSLPAGHVFWGGEGGPDEREPRGVHLPL